MSKLLLTIDVGTTAIKFTIYDTKQSLFSQSERIITRHNGNKATQNPTEIFKKIKKGIKQLAKKFPDIDTIGLSTAMHTLIPKKSNETLKMYLWSDNRSKEVIHSFKQNKEVSNLFYKKTGTPIHGMSPFAKLLYFKNEHPLWYQEITQWLDMKSYLVSELTGHCMVDYSVASATGLFNSETGEWDEEILDYLSMNKTKLPEVVHPKKELVISKKVRNELNLRPNTKIIVGSSDGCLVSLASFNQSKSKKTLTLGTSGAIRIISENRYLSENQNLFCYYLDETSWVIGGPTNNGGVIIEWLSQLFFDNKESLFNSLDDLKKTDNLLFFPYLQGERAPLWNENQTGSFTGLTISHGRQEIIQAVLEGIMFNLKLIFEQLPPTDKNEPLILSGGVFKKPLLAQMIATILNQPCIISNQSEPSQGLKDLWHKSESLKGETIYMLPKQEEVMFYQKKYNAFKKGIRSL